MIFFSYHIILKNKLNAYDGSCLPKLWNSWSLWQGLKSFCSGLFGHIGKMHKVFFSSLSHLTFLCASSCSMWERWTRSQCRVSDILMTVKANKSLFSLVRLETLECSYLHELYPFHVVTLFFFICLFYLVFKCNFYFCLYR